MRVGVGRRFVSLLIVAVVVGLGAAAPAQAVVGAPPTSGLAAAVITPACASRSGAHTYGEISVYVRYTRLPTDTTYVLEIQQYPTTGDDPTSAVPGAVVPPWSGGGMVIDEAESVAPTADGSLAFDYPLLASGSSDATHAQGSVHWVAGITYALVLRSFDLRPGLVSVVTLRDCINPDPGLGAYVTKVYRDLFGRTPDAEGLATWTAKLATGEPYGSVANSITGSEEYRSRLIQASYQRYLGRDAEPAGLAFWLDLMRAGWQIEQMQAGFVASDEYYQRSGGTDRGWIALMYTTVLGRTPAPTEVDHWQGVLAASGTRYDVALGFLYSTEHLTAVVDDYYLNLLHRHIDPTGQVTWVGLIQSGHRDEEIIAGIVASLEYRASV